MELDFEKLIISEEQAHSFALAVFNDIRNYFLDQENYINSLLKFSANVILSIDGIYIIANNIYNYSLCKY